MQNTSKFSELQTRDSTHTFIFHTMANLEFPFTEICSRICELGIGFKISDIEDYRLYEDSIRLRVVHYSRTTRVLYFPATVTQSDAAKIIEVFKLFQIPCSEIQLADKPNLKRWHRDRNYGPHKLFLNCQALKVKVLTKSDEFLNFYRKSSIIHMKLVIMWIRSTECVSANLLSELLRLVVSLIFGLPLTNKTDVAA